MAAGSTPPTQDPQSQQWTVIERDGYRYPPGLSLNLLFYLRRRFFKPSNPILLFEHLAAAYGRIAHYKLGWQHIVFINHPEFIREVLVNHPQEMIKERTQRRMKILLGEGLITSEGAFHMRQRRIAAPASAIAPRRWPPAKTKIALRLSTLTSSVVSTINTAPSLSANPGVF